MANIQLPSGAPKPTKTSQTGDIARKPGVYVPTS